MAPSDFLSELAIAWEKAAKLSPETGVRQVTVRSGTFLHDSQDNHIISHNCEFFSLCIVSLSVEFCTGVVLGRQGGMIQQLYLPFFFGLGGPIASGSQYLPWIHVQDIARLIQFSIENESVTGILNGVAPQVSSHE